ncbi:MAG TPA: ABC transporter substrate-binding protein, partial [Candidatus Dormibacteraeota bacterium]
HDRLRRDLHGALPTGPGFPGPGLLTRIIDDLRSAGHRAPRRRWRRAAWPPAVAGAALLLVVAGSTLFPRLQGQMYAGRVEFLATSNFGSVQFLSSQAQPASEYRDMQRRVLPGFNGIVDFNSQPTATQDIDRILYEESAGKPTMDLVALTRSELLALQARGALEDLTPLLQRLQRDRQFAPATLDRARSDTDRQYYIPWLQATYMMVVNRQALRYLPAGADVNHLSYEQLIAWGQNLEAATGERLIGLPADLNGPRGGLVYRFLQGYAYPAYTGTTLTGFRSPEAVRMWQTLRRLWSVTNPWSTHYSNMQDPLTTGEIWIAWDHQARLTSALADSAHFVAVPAPSGPRGLGYMSVTVGLAIPRGAHNPDGARALIDWLTKPSQQATASASLNFLPAVQHVDLTGVALAESRVATAYGAEPGAVQSLAPAALGTGGDEFTAVYQDTFRRIVLANEDIPAVLNEEAARLQELVNAAGAACWPPDPPSRGPCQIR